MRWWARSRLRTKIFLAFSAKRELLTTGQVFQELVAERAARLLTNTTLLAGDFALKRVLATYDGPTLTSAALSYQQRIGVDLLWMTDESGVLLADSLGRQKSGRSLTAFPPVKESLESGEAAAAIAEVDGALFQLVAVPVLAPDVIGFLLLGQGIDDPLAQQLEQDTGSHISFLTRAQIFASSWSPEERKNLFPAGQPIDERVYPSCAKGRRPVWLCDPDSCQGGEGFSSTPHTTQQ